jgi:hypothetical protein
MDPSDFMRTRRVWQVWDTYRSSWRTTFPSWTWNGQIMHKKTVHWRLIEQEHLREKEWGKVRNRKHAIWWLLEIRCHSLNLKKKAAKMKSFCSTVNLHWQCIYHVGGSGWQKNATLNKKIKFCQRKFNQTHTSVPMNTPMLRAGRR